MSLSQCGDFQRHAASWFETRGVAALLTMRVRDLIPALKRDSKEQNARDHLPEMKKPPRFPAGVLLKHVADDRDQKLR